MTIHNYKKMVFLVDFVGEIYRFNYKLYGSKKYVSKTPRNIIRYADTQRISQNIVKLTLDWLRDYLYIVTNKRVKEKAILLFALKTFLLLFIASIDVFHVYDKN